MDKNLVEAVNGKEVTNKKEFSWKEAYQWLVDCKVEETQGKGVQQQEGGCSHLRVAKRVPSCHFEK